MIFFVLLIVLVIVLVYVYLTWNFDYWFKRGVPAPKAKVLLGDLPNGLTRKENVVYDIEKIYK
jgi:cytochrome P450 family 28